MKKILAVFMALVIFASFAFFAVGSGKKDKKPDDLVIEESTTDDVYEPELTELTEEHLQSFEELLNGMPFSLDGFENYYNKKNTIINSFICSAFWAMPDGTMYDYYFPDQYKKLKLVPTEDGAGTLIEYEFDADKVLFILNDVFGLGVTESYSNGDFVFMNGNFYYTAALYGKGGDGETKYEVDSYERVEDGYFKIKTTYIYTDYYDNNSVTKGESWYYIAKPSKHEVYGDYWKIKEFGFEDEIIWSNDSSYEDDEIGWKRKLINELYVCKYEYWSSSSDKYYLADVDGDDVPEMLVDYNSGVCIYYYNGQVFQKEDLPYGEVYVMPQKGLIRFNHSYRGNCGDIIYKIDKGTFYEVESGEYYGSMESADFYQWEGSEVTEQQYYNKLDSVFDTHNQKSLEDYNQYSYSTIFEAVEDY